VAQEFRLAVSVNATNLSRHLAFGFDGNASDTMFDGAPKDSLLDKKYGELLLPEGGAPGDFDARMTDRTLGRTYLTFYDSTTFDGGFIDIRRKPSADSFQLQYELYQNAADIGVPVSISWDNSNIPTSVQHVYLSPEGNPDIKVRLDMKTENQLSIDARFDSASLYKVMLITVVYKGAKNAVTQTGPLPNAVSVFPNPMDSRSSVRFMLDEDGMMRVSAYDIIGKKVTEKIIKGTRGENEVTLDRNDFPSRSGVYLVRITGTEGNTIVKTASLIVQ
jgi:hypothetical protein